MELQEKKRRIDETILEVEGGGWGYDPCIPRRRMVTAAYVKG